MNSLTHNRTEMTASSRRAWLVLLGCCMMQGGSLGAVMNTMGLFFTAVSQDLGFTVGGISLYKTIAGLSSCLLLPFVGKVLARWDTRITLSLSAVVMAVCTALMGCFHQLWQWYAAAFVLGIASAMLLTTSEPIILANWFHHNLGLAVGISGAFSGLAGMACNLALERVISRCGWRMGYLATGFICLVMVLPMTLFAVRIRPENGGRTGRAAANLPQETVPPMTARRRHLVLAGLVLNATCAMFCVGFSGQIVTYATSMGKTMALGAVLVSCSMISNAGGKVLLGAANDRFGLKAACGAGLLFAVPAFVLLMIPNTGAMTAGSLLYGAGMALSVMTPPLLTRKFFSAQDYPRAFSLVMMLSTLASSFSTWILGRMYDGFGSYRPALYLCLTMCACYLALCGGLWVIRQNLAKKTS